MTDEEKLAEDSFNSKKLLYKSSMDKYSYIDGFIAGLKAGEAKAKKEIEAESAELKEKRIAELERKLEQTEKDLADYQFNYPTIKELQEEIAELKGILNIRSCQSCRRYNRACPNDGSCNHYSKWEGFKNPQLTKAKDIIRELLNSCFGYNSKTVNYEVKVKAEQFLKEVSE